MRSLSIDILKIVLAVFVVCLHLHIFRNIYPSLSYVLVNGLFRISVPVFLIISGYYFFKVDNIEKLKKWSIRILLLYVVWSAIYFPIWKADNYILYIVFGYHHLWYLIGMLLSGLLLFALRKASPAVLSILLLFLFSCGYIIQLLGNGHFFKGKIDEALNIFPMYRNFLFVGFPFLTIGFLINKLKIDLSKKPSFIVLVISLGLVILEAVFNYRVLKLDQKESIDLLFSLLIACPVVFLYCKGFSVKTNVKVLASFSTAVYLIHPLLIELVYKSPSPLIKEYRAVFFFVSLVISSLILVVINRKLKYLL